MTSRRNFLLRHAHGFGALALSALHAQENRGVDPLRVRPPHLTPRAKSVILLFMDGGVSHVDTFDPKPRLKQDSGQPIPLARP
jgi:hypothetical protein